MRIVVWGFASTYTFDSYEEPAGVAALANLDVRHVSVLPGEKPGAFSAELDEVKEMALEQTADFNPEVERVDWGDVVWSFVVWSFVDETRTERIVTVVGQVEGGPEVVVSGREILA